MTVNRTEFALVTAATAHAGQKDKADQPYVFHPIAVMMILREKLTKQPHLIPTGFELEDILIAALLHDTAEDTPYTLDMIERDFGSVVRDIVDAVTRRRVPQEPIDPRQTQPLGETYRQFIKRAGEHPAGRLVKLADLTHNLSRIQNLPPEERDIEKRYLRALEDLGGL